MIGLPPTVHRYGLARVLSKQGVCSRSQAERYVRAGRVRVNGQVVLDPEYPTGLANDRLALDDKPLSGAGRVYLALNKPRGLVTSTQDEQGRDTVYRCFDMAQLPWIAPAGRLDKASEGLLLFSNDPVWAARITDPRSGPEKTYHVQVTGTVNPDVLPRLLAGIEDGGEQLSAHAVRWLRSGGRTTWLEIVLSEGRNRHIRRLLAALGFEVKRLVRVAIGPLILGNLPKGGWRLLSAEEAGILTASR